MTIKDIARESGFSKSTISRVLKDDPHVKASTRTKVKEILKKNRFVRSELAASMVSGSIRIILIIAGDIANPFYGYSVKSIEGVFERAGYMTVVCSSSYDSQKEIRYIKLAAECRFAGVIMMTAIEAQELYDSLDTLSCPVVLMNRFLKDREYDAIVQDNYDSAVKATKYLIDCGHRKIMHLAGIEGSSTAKERFAGYRSAMDDAGLEVRPDMVVSGDLTSECGAELAVNLSSRRSDVTALVVANDAMAIGFARRWARLGKRIPDDMSIICYDPTEVLENMAVSISSVGVDSGVLGEYAAVRLLQRIDGDQSPRRRSVLKAEMNITGSIKTLCASDR